MKVVRPSGAREAITGSMETARDRVVLVAVVLTVCLTTTVHADDATSVEPQPSTLNVFDFEDGTLQGWKVVSGKAGKLPTGPETARADQRFNQQGKFFIGLYENPRHDAATIVLQSPTFTLRSGTISLLIGGGDHLSHCYVGLYDASDGSEIKRETGRNSEAMTRRYWDVGAVKGRQVYLKIVDSHTGGWGHINVDDIRELTPAEELLRAAEIEARERRYQQWLASVEAPSRRKPYTGEALKDLAMPLGGIGGGHVSICGDGAIRQWQIFGRVNDKCVVPDSFFAVWAKPARSKPVARVLQQSPRGGLPPVDNIEFIGEYPIAEIRYHDRELPVSVSLRAFSSHIPMNARDSAIPAAVFEFTVANRGGEAVDVSVLSTLQNAAGYDGMSAIHGIWNKGYGGNLNVPLLDRSGMRGVALESVLLKPDARQYGTMCLGALAPEARVLSQWSDIGRLWRSFSADGTLPASEETGASKPGRTWNAAVAVPVSLGPYQSAVIPFVWSWHFPNLYVWWDDREGQPRLGRMYGNWFADARAAAVYVADNYRRLASDTEKFRRTLSATTLPYWMLTRIFAQSSTLVSTVCMWIEDGSFVAFEGAGCCPMNCTHVWNYEQQLAFLFPELERNMRRIDLEVQQNEDGSVRHRTRLPLSLPRETGPFVDGHLGTILKCYREHRQSADGKWLDAMWPRIKKAVDFVLDNWDRNKDGVLVCEQWNTYDAAMYGPNTFIGTLYLAALRAAEEMARIEREDVYADRLRSIYLTGSRRLDDACWNGEYYQQIERKPTPPTSPMQGRLDWLREDWPEESDNPNVNRPYGKGCHADQLLGQWWAHILDLGYLLPRDRVNKALDSVMRYNWVTDFGEVRQWPRAFAGAGDPGLYICTWPYGGKPANETLYSFEVWTGIEYELAALMLYEGFPKQACQIMKAAADRYNGVPRGPIMRNPWSDVECSDHYARAMASWSVLLAAQGYSYCGPDMSLGFEPVASPDDHASFFTGAQGWGLFTQRRAHQKQINTLKLEYGVLDLKTLTLHPPQMAESVQVRVNGRDAKFASSASEDGVQITPVEPLTLKAGDEVRVVLAWKN